MDTAEGSLRHHAYLRLGTDKQLSLAWLIVPAYPALLVGWFVYSWTLEVLTPDLPAGALPPGCTAPGHCGAGPLIGLIVLLYFIPILLLADFALFLLMLHQLVERRNLHFRRQLLLYEDLRGKAEHVGKVAGVDIAPYLSKLDGGIGEARIEEKDRDETLWVMLTAVTLGFAAYYVYYFLMRDLYRHEQRENTYLEGFMTALGSAGKTLNLPRREQAMHRRNFFLYLGLMLATLGVFGVYWAYTLLSDGNKHLRQQAIIEDAIVSQMTPIQARKAT